MAKPLKSIPLLTGDDAIRFLENMDKTNKRKPTKKEKELFKEIMAKQLQVTEKEAEECLLRSEGFDVGTNYAIELIDQRIKLLEKEIGGIRQKMSKELLKEDTDWKYLLQCHNEWEANELVQKELKSLKDKIGDKK